MNRKQHTIIVYDKNGNFKTSISPEIIVGDINFNFNINSGCSEFNLRINSPFDQYDEGGLIAFSNIVEIFLVNEDNKDGKLIYKGVMPEYNPFIKLDGDEGITLNLLGLLSLLNQEYYKSGVNYTVTHNNIDPANIIKAIIDNYATETGNNLIWYDVSSIDLTGVLVSYEFKQLKWIDAIKKAFELVPANWYWYIDIDGKFYLKQKPSSSTHQFTMGINLDEVDAVKTARKIVNHCRVYYTDVLYQEFSDATSISTYGKFEEVIADSDIQDASSALERAKKVVGDNKDPKISTKIAVNNNYDIGKIKPGDTCELLNFNTEKTFTDNMQIYSISYKEDAVTLNLSDYSPSLSREIKNDK